VQWLPRIALTVSPAMNSNGECGVRVSFQLNWAQSTAPEVREDHDFDNDCSPDKPLCRVSLVGKASVTPGQLAAEFAEHGSLEMLLSKGCVLELLETFDRADPEEARTTKRIVKVLRCIFHPRCKGGNGREGGCEPEEHETDKDDAVNEEQEEDDEETEDDEEETEDEIYDLIDKHGDEIRIHSSSRVGYAELRDALERSQDARLAAHFRETSGWRVCVALIARALALALAADPAIIAAVQKQ